MKFGLFHSVQLPNPSEQDRYYREALEQVLHAERHGYNSVWFTEHHFTRHGIVSATLSVLAYLAGVTDTIRLGTAVTVLPFHNPVQLAEQTATVDLLSNGRLDLGVGRGYQWGEFHRMGVPMDEATRRFEESMEVLTRAWTSIEPFDHRGEFWSFNDLTVQPKPVQRPHPPVYVAASGSDSVARVVRNDWNLLVGQAETQEQVGRQVEFYRDALAEVESPYTADRVVVARAMYAAETTEQARREAEIPFMWFKQTGQEVSAPPGRRADLLPEEFAAYRSRYSPDARFDYAALCDDVMLFGSPDHIAERIGLLRDSGVENLIFFVNFGGIEHQKVLDSLELFAAEVMPQFAD
jgi:alkanesulfonate monooxygenase SsuD/methylene tetrahydromethanopterin reductase-like flavin-dependent oxidoreductase (luciferase family)